MTKLMLDLSSTLRQVRDPVIKVECSLCGRTETFKRAEIVKKHGAGVTFRRLRRMAAMGCDRINAGCDDRCGAQFPFLAPAYEANTL